MGSLRLDGVRIIDGSGAPPLDDGVILIEGERLSYVGARAAAPTALADQVLDLSGMTALPGLTDLHVHSTFDADMRAYLAHGVTSIRYAGITQQAAATMAQRIQPGELPGPRVFSCGPMLDMAPPAYPEWTSVLETPEDAAREAARLIDEEHVDALIATQRITAPLLQAIVETAHQRGVPVTGQILWVDGGEAAEIGIDGLENTSRIFVSRDYPPERLFQYHSIPHRLAMVGRAWASVDWGLTERILDSMARRGVRYCPTLVVMLACLGDLDETLANDPSYATFGERERANWSGFRNRISHEWSDEDRQYWRRAMDNQREWIRRFRALGGSIVSGTDMQFGGLTFSLELEQLQQCGMSPMEVLVAATSEAARALGRESEQGTLVAGTLADVLVVDGDPLADLGALRRVAQVVKQGELVAL